MAYQLVKRVPVLFTELVLVVPGLVGVLADSPVHAESLLAGPSSYGSPTVIARNYSTGFRSGQKTDYGCLETGPP